MDLIGKPGKGLQVEGEEERKGGDRQEVKGCETICMEIQKTSNSQSNLEKEEWNWRNQPA